jgi:hypothetical protein
MHEIAPGLHHWTARHPGIGAIVHSHYVEPAGLVLDPLLPPEGLDVLDGRVPERVALTNRHHYRDAERLVEAYGVPVLVCEAGLHEVRGRPGVETFAWGEEIAPGVTAVEVGVLCPDETALRIDHGGGALAVADGVMAGAAPGEPLRFVADEHLGEDPPAVRRGLAGRYRELVAEQGFEVLLMAHGAPVVGGASRALEAFASAHV